MVRAIRDLQHAFHRRGRERQLRQCRMTVEALEERTLFSNVSWTGNAHDNNWDTRGNWNTNSLPGPGDDVTINTSADVDHSNNVTDTIKSLTSTEPLTISGGTLPNRSRSCLMASENCYIL